MEPVRGRELRDFFLYVIDVLEYLDIPYMVVGGYAVTFYGEPRMTIDVDIIVDMQRKHIVDFVGAFPIPDFYASKEGVLDSLRRRYPFNVIQPATGAKVDLIPLPRDPFSRISFRRRKRMPIGETEHHAWFISPEDVIVSKLATYQKTGSDKHLRDARGVLFVQHDELDWQALRQYAAQVGVNDLLEELMRTL